MPPPPQLNTMMVSANQRGAKAVTQDQALQEGHVEVAAGPIESYQCSACRLPSHSVSGHGWCEKCEEKYSCELCDWCGGPQWWRDYVSGKLEVNYEG